jgi:hypothetical protein
MSARGTIDVLTIDNRLVVTLEADGKTGGAVRWQGGAYALVREHGYWVGQYDTLIDGTWHWVGVVSAPRQTDALCQLARWADEKGLV